MTVESGRAPQFPIAAGHDLAAGAGRRTALGIAARMSEIRSNRAQNAPGSLNLIGVQASITEARRDAPHGFLVASQVFELSTQPALVQRPPPADTS